MTKRRFFKKEKDFKKKEINTALLTRNMGFRGYYKMQKDARKFYYRMFEYNYFRNIQKKKEHRSRMYPENISSGITGISPETNSDSFPTESTALQTEISD